VIKHESTQQDPCPTKEDLRMLSLDCEVDEDRIEAWLEQRRKKQKRKGNCNRKNAYPTILGDNENIKEELPFHIENKMRIWFNKNRQVSTV